MNLFPYYKYYIKTNLNMYWISKRLSNNIATPKLILNPFNESNFKNPFRGYYNDDSFLIRQVLRYPNSFNPIIRGIIKDKGAYTEICLKFRLPYSCFIIWILMLTLTTIISILAVFFGLPTEPKVPDYILLVFFLLFLFTEYMMVLIPFNKELETSIEKLEGILR